MDKKELRKLSKNQLIKIILNQEKRLQKVEQLLNAFDNPHTPSSKKQKKSEQPKQEGRFPGKPQGSAGGGINMPPADITEEHSLDSCPDCHNDLGDPIKKTIQKQMDLLEKLAVCTEHLICHYHCNHCDKDITAAELGGRYGPRIKALAARLKEQGLSCQETALTIREIGFLSFCPATIVIIIVFFSTLLQPIRDRFEKEILKALYIHADETGLRKDDQSGYVWGFFTKGIALLNAEMSREKIIANNLLAKFSGVTISRWIFRI